MIRITVAVSSALAIMVLVACGSDGSKSTPTAAPEPTQTPAVSDVLSPVASTIVDTAIADGRFTTLVAALQAAELVDTLSGEGPFTVFAPTDDAFGSLPAGTVEGLLADVPALADVLTYHVVPGRVLAEDVLGLSSATTVQGSDLGVTVDAEGVLINEVRVLITDIETSNGVIHVIDGVLLPPAT